MFQYKNISFINQIILMIYIQLIINFKFQLSFNTLILESNIQY